MNFTEHARVFGCEGQHLMGILALPDAPLDTLAAAVRGFDAADEAFRRKAIAALVRELGALLPIPVEISALAGGVSAPSGKLAKMKPAAAPKGPTDWAAREGVRR